MVTTTDARFSTFVSRLILLQPADGSANHRGAKSCKNASPDPSLLNKPVQSCRPLWDRRPRSGYDHSFPWYYNAKCPEMRGLERCGLKSAPLPQRLKFPAIRAGNFTGATAFGTKNMIPREESGHVSAQTVLFRNAGHDCCPRGGRKVKP